MSTVPSISLSDGRSIPQLGLGVWQVDPDSTARVVRDAIAAGYRSIDTAEGYQNEEGVGEAIRSAGVPRDELFITSKLRNGGHRRDQALKAFDETMRKLGLDELDLFLIHWPVPQQNKYAEAWKTLVELQKSGRVRSIGVSNFNQDHLERIIGETGVVPVTNQIELHPGLQQPLRAGRGTGLQLERRRIRVRAEDPERRPRRRPAGLHPGDDGTVAHDDAATRPGRPLVALVESLEPGGLEPIGDRRGGVVRRGRVADESGEIGEVGVTVELRHPPMMPDAAWCRCTAAGRAAADAVRRSARWPGAASGPP